MQQVISANVYAGSMHVRSDLLHTLYINQAHAAEVIEQAFVPGLYCSRCHSKAFYRHGSKSGLQRFRCCTCGRTFNRLSCTPLARLRHESM